MRSEKSSRSPHARRRWLAGLLTALSLTVVMVLGGVGAAGSASAAPLSKTTFITWNMQGKSNGVDSKWQSVVKGYVQNAPVVGVQEPGPKPPGNLVSSSGRLDEYIWNAGSNSKPLPVHIYFLHTSGNDNRVNTAIVSREVPNTVEVALNPLPAGRDSVGIRLGKHWYFSYHALSGGGGDAAGMLGVIDKYTNNEDWTVGADFNREPSTFQGKLPNNAVIYNTGQPTHQNGKELDYFVAKPDQGKLPVTRLAKGASASDHYGVQVGPDQKVDTTEGAPAPTG